jgi:hypothetical protein
MEMYKCQFFFFLFAREKLFRKGPRDRLRQTMRASLFLQTRFKVSFSKGKGTGLKLRKNTNDFDIMDTDIINIRLIENIVPCNCKLYQGITLARVKKYNRQLINPTFQ